MEKNNEVLQVINKIKKVILKYVAIGAAIVIGVVAILAVIVGIIASIFSNYEEDGSGGYVYIGAGNIGYSSISMTEEDLLHLYTVVINERGAGGNSTENTKLSYVVSVVLNRVLCGTYGGNTVKAVVAAPSQFAGYNTSTWNEQYTAVSNYVQTGNSNNSSWTNSRIQNVIDVCTSVIQTGDTTGTASHPEGGATGFAGPSYVRTWLASPAYINAGWYGLFNDTDGKAAETSGTYWTTGEAYGTISYMARTADVAKLSQFKQVGVQGTITGNYNADIATNAKALVALLQNSGWGYHEMYIATGGNVYVPIVNSDGSANTPGSIGRNISCAAFVSQVLYNSGILKSGTRIVWASHDAWSIINNFSSKGVTLTQITDCNQAQPGDIIHYYNPSNSSAYHTAIITDVQDGYFRKTSSAEFMNGFSEQVSFSDDRSWRGYSPLNYLSQRWLVFRVTAVDGVTSK